MRFVFLKAASAFWGIPVQELRTAQGRVFHRKSDKTISYGTLVSQGMAVHEIAEFRLHQLKPPEDFQLINKLVFYKQ